MSTSQARRVLHRRLRRNVLEGGFASGNTLRVATDGLTENVTTVSKQSDPFNPDASSSQSPSAVHPRVPLR